ncbi:MAG: hypothetical protein KDD34_08380 [Bdellovibrionales bacterium]|nr:hypothetical protein [Bdellovibrionales bacterium]
MKLVTTLMIVFSVLVSQASAHQCFGECASEKSEKLAKEKIDHSCCEELNTLDKKSSHSHTCSESLCFEISSLTQKEFFLSVNHSLDGHDLYNLSPKGFYLKRPAIIDERPPDIVLTVRAKSYLGLYILLRRLRVS